MTKPCCDECAKGMPCKSEKGPSSEKPKKGLNKWMLFLQEFRSKHKEEFAGKSSKVIVAAAAVEYKNLPK